MVQMVTLVVMVQCQPTSLVAIKNHTHYTKYTRDGIRTRNLPIPWLCIEVDRASQLRHTGIGSLGLFCLFGLSGLFLTTNQPTNQPTNQHTTKL